jgi:hypothetical protein
MTTKKKRKNNRPKKSSRKIPIRSFLGVFLLFFTIYLATSLSSLSSGDLSLFQTGYGPIKNFAGETGSHAAEFLFHSFGYSAYWVIIYGGLHGFFLLFNKKFSNPLKWSQIIGLFTLAIVILIVSGISPEMFPQNSSMPEGPGGMIAHKIALYLIALFGWWGSLILLVPIAVIAFLVFFRLSIIDFLEGIDIKKQS